MGARECGGRHHTQRQYQVAAVEFIEFILSSSTAASQSSLLKSFQRTEDVHLACAMLSLAGIT